MKDETITVTVEIYSWENASERAVLMEAIDALTHYACSLPRGRLRPQTKEIKIT